MVPGGREPRDLDIQFEGSVEGALELEAALREEGIPANVRSLQAPGARDMLGFAAAWRRVKYQQGRIVADPLAKDFIDNRVAIVLSGMTDSDLALKSAQWVLKEYPGATVEVR